MIDIFTVVVPHALMALAIWQLIHRDDLDLDPILPGTAEALARLKQGFGRAQGAAKASIKRKDSGPDGKPPRA